MPVHGAILPFLVLALLMVSTGQLSAHPIKQNSPSPSGEILAGHDLNKRSIAYMYPTWKQTPGRLRQVQLDCNVVCGVNSLGDVYCASHDIYHSPNWYHVGKMSQITLSRGRLYGVTASGQLWLSDYQHGNWRPIPTAGAPFKQVDLDVNVLCGVDIDNRAWCAELGTNFENPQWFKVRDGLKSVSVSLGRMYGVTELNEVWYADNYKDPQSWRRVSNTLVQVELRGRVVCGVNMVSDIFCASWNVSHPHWEHLPGKLKHISVSNGALFGANMYDELYVAY